MKLFYRMLLAALFISVISAGSALAAAPSVVGMVNYNTVISDSIGGKQADAELVKLAKEKETELEAKKQVLAQMRADYKQNEATMTAEQKKAKEMEYDRLYKEFQEFGQEANAEINRKRIQLRAKVIGEINEVVRNLAKEGKYTMVIDSAAVPYCQGDADLTAKVVAKYNEIKK